MTESMTNVGADAFGRPFRPSPIEAELEKLLGEMASAYNRAIRRDQPLANPRIRMAYGAAVELAKAKTPATIAKLREMVAIFEAYHLAGDADIRNAALQGTIDLRYTLRRDPRPAPVVTTGPGLTPTAATIIAELRRRAIKLSLTPEGEIVAHHAGGGIATLHKTDAERIEARRREIVKILEREAERV